MKNKIVLNLFIIIFMIIISSMLYAQNLVEIDNQWNIAVYPTFSPNTTSYSIRIGEDTTLNNIVYNKVYYSSDSLNTSWQFYNSYLREDLTKKVFLKEGSSEDILIYDFSLEVNDTFLVEDVCTLIVHEVDSVMLNNGEVRKRLKLGIKEIPDWGEEYWIDGIGSNFGLISHFGFCYSDYSDALLCFYSNSELLYPETPPSCFITPVREIKPSNFKVSPNPFFDVLNVESEEFDIEYYIIYDITGRIINEGMFGNLNYRINLQQIKTGFYILVLRDMQGKLYSQKLIKK